MEREIGSKIEDIERAHVIRDARETNVETSIIKVDTSDWQIFLSQMEAEHPPPQKIEDSSRSGQCVVRR
ncbi:hypothetical protein GT037_003722 [Alternaria burnsii]|uniref:Uncharacterized protein n=1 Tax=Alternaria burnsii TaxID=1187904 RepID=A0A8H7B697_9PLEO|nr:uncharacterized protein GT037_003722 [Alternaria burnsii]KAF7678341.1 hypothetical protein GT037_003722 [Alternaria burnsii]